MQNNMKTSQEPTFLDQLTGALQILFDEYEPTAEEFGAAFARVINGHGCLVGALKEIMKKADKAAKPKTEGVELKEQSRFAVN